MSATVQLRARRELPTQGATYIDDLAWSCDGRWLAWSSVEGLHVWDARDDTVTVLGDSPARPVWRPDGRLFALGFAGWQLWDPVVGEILADADVADPLTGLPPVAWHPTRELLAALRRPHDRSSAAAQVLFVDMPAGPVREKEYARSNSEYVDTPRVMAWSPDGRLLAASTVQCTLLVLDADGQHKHTLEGHHNLITDVVWVDERHVASTSTDATVRLWDAAQGTATYVLEGHETPVRGVDTSPDQRLLFSADETTVRVWDTTTWQPVGTAELSAVNTVYGGKGQLRCAPDGRTLAVVGGDQRSIELLTYAVTADVTSPPAAQYANARVLLVGDSSVGKSGLGLVLAGDEFRATDSTHARHTWVMSSEEVPLPDGRSEIREIFLWDLAGQAGYRPVHQLYLSAADVALVVFDARDDKDPFAGVRYWARALDLAAQLAPSGAAARKRVLVAARVDRGGVPATAERIEQVARDHGFSCYVATSAKEGWGVAELAAAVRDAISWDDTVRVVSSTLFLSVKSFLVAEKQAGRLLATPTDLMISYRRQSTTEDLDVLPERHVPLWRRLVDSLRSPDTGAGGAGHHGSGQPPEVSTELFAGCIDRVESQGLIVRLAFGDLVLLQPELLDAYAAAIVNAARSQPDGLGTIAEDDVIEARFLLPEQERVADRGQERLLLIATVQELLRHEVALQEPTDNGTQLVFPSQLTREWPDLPHVPHPDVKVAFEGPVSNVYAALVVRLSRSGRFRLSEIWRTAVVYEATTGGRCGLMLSGEDMRGSLSMFFEGASEQTRFDFEDYIHVHLERRAVRGTVVRTKTHACSTCGTALSDQQVEALRRAGRTEIRCMIDQAVISLADPWTSYRTGRAEVVAEMDRTADEARDRVVSTQVVVGKEATSDFDVFLCHNRKDKPEVLLLAQQLRGYGLLPWVDAHELRPGLSWQDELEAAFDRIGSAAVVIGASGVGPWQRKELNAFLRRFVQRGLPVIPVLLQTAPAEPALPAFLEEMTWVDFREDPTGAMDSLRWGITGERPRR